jgi:hypothetical protein
VGIENLDLLRVEMTTTPDNPVVPKLARRWALPTRARSANVQSSEVDASISCGSASCVKSVFYADANQKRVYEAQPVSFGERRPVRTALPPGPAASIR